MTETQEQTRSVHDSDRVRAAIVLGHAGAGEESFGITGVERVVQLLLQGFAASPIEPYTIYPGRGRLGRLFASHSHALLERQPERRYDSAFIQATSEFLQQHDIDVVLSIGLRQDFHLALVCRRLGIPHVVHRPVALADETMPAWRRFLYGLPDTWSLQQCREIIACSQASAARMRSTQGLPDSKVVVVPNGVEFPQVTAAEARAARAALGVSPDALMLVGVGQLIERKSFHLFVEAVGRAAAQCSQRLECVLLGEGPERARLQRTAQEQDVPLHMPGFVEAPAHSVAAADISVLPSLAEGMPLVVLEAMALGVPTIATNVAGTPEVIDDASTGLLVPPGNVAALTAAILRLAQDAALRTTLGRAGQERARARFSVEAMVQGFVASLQRNARPPAGVRRGRR